MKRWAIVDLKSLEILNTYASTRSRLDSFGGPWGDSSLVIHLEVPSDLGDSIKCVFLDSTELLDEEGDVIADLVPGPTQVAHDSQGRKILNAEGKPMVVSSFEYRPRMGSAHRIVQK